MTEKEYRVNLLKSRAEIFKGKRVALYGTGKNSDAILEGCPEIQILGVIDEKYSGTYFHGKQLIWQNDIVKLRIDTVIIGAQPDSAHAVYERNVVFFRAHNITVYDMYGQNMDAYENKLCELNVLYLKESLDNAKKAIDEHECIGMNYEDVIAIADESDDTYTFKRDNRQTIDLYLNLWKEHIFPRKTIIELVNYALHARKKVFVLSECGFSTDFIVSTMKKWGVSEGYSVYTRRDNGYYKINGLFREVKEIGKKTKVLYFGTDLYYDGIIAASYGYDYLPIKKASELLDITIGTTGISKEIQKNVTYRKILLDGFNDPFCLYGTNGMPKAGTKTSELIKDILLDYDIHTSKYDYKPVIIRETPGPDLDKLRFAFHVHPTVSIIIPVYNQFDYTYKCLKSIYQHSGSIAYEIIIADDCSTDETKEIEKYVEEIKVLHNKSNLRFLRNCNNAIGSAAGKYILFLNNDTQVQPGWLSSLVKLMERDKKAGMVGSKLVYPDGSLQEAGGIIWKDGSAWNFGHLDDPLKPEYNYVKEVDYISGASIMIRKDLLLQLNGFDDRFAPAYCEDSDLAFRIREAGYKVLYQPLSVVVHFEGVSNGTDTSSGQKSYQIINSKKFYEKWKDILEKENNPNGINPFLARDRSLHKRTLLFVDHYVPQYDKDAGSRTVFAYLKMFVNAGYNIKFIGDNFFPHQPYTETLQQMGIEVLYGNWYGQHWTEWITDNGKNFDYAFLNRPHIAEKYIDLIREKTNAKILYYGHDLHFMRCRREFEITRDKSILQEAEMWKDKEFSLMRKADITSYPSEIEVEEIHRIDPNINAMAIPAYIYNDVDTEEYNFADRRDLFFIGGFTHGPNVDAVNWFISEILPIVSRSIPDIKIHLAGSNMPQNLINLASENVVIEGTITDEQLEQFYHSMRLNVVPLRYGAGIKGKIIESMRYGLPIVTTPCGAEGILGSESILAIGKNAEEIATQIVSLYNNKTELSRMSLEGKKYIQDHYSENSAIEVMSKVFDLE